MNRIVNGIILVCLLTGCSGIDPTADLVLLESGEIEKGFSTRLDEKEISNQSTIHQIRYSIDVLSALEFLNRRGEEPDPNDVADLRRESVLILEMESTEELQEIFFSSRMQMDKEDAIKYLIGEISNDLVLKQGENEYSATGLQYDGMLKNKLRLFLFYKDIDVHAAIHVSFYDRLFGAGLIQLKHS